MQKVKTSGNFAKNQLVCLKMQKLASLKQLASSTPYCVVFLYAKFPYVGLVERLDYGL